MNEEWGYRCTACGFETTNGAEIRGPELNGVTYLRCPICSAVGEFVDAPPPGVGPAFASERASPNGGTV